MGRQLFLHHYLPAHLASALVAGALVEFIFNVEPLSPEELDERPSREGKAPAPQRAPRARAHRDAKPVHGVGGDGGRLGGAGLGVLVLHAADVRQARLVGGRGGEAEVAWV